MARFYPVMGLATVLVLVAIVYVAYTANRGLPLAAEYSITAELPNANRLSPTSEVRIGGIRVGQVESVEAMPATDAQQPHARAELSLEPAAGPLPVDTTVKVRPASILGATYVELTPGSSERTLGDGGSLPLPQASPNVELTDLLDIFDRATAQSTRSALASVGNGLAGRGVALNRSIGELAGLLGPIERVSAALASPSARLRELVVAYESFARGLAPASEELADLMGGGARTFAAVAREREALGAAIEAAPGAERATAAALRELEPSLDQLAGLVKELRGAVPELAPAAHAGARALKAGVPPLRDLPPLARRLRTALSELGKLGRDPATDGTIRKLTEAVNAAGTTLDVLVPAQVQCNVISLWGQSFGYGFGGLGFAQGPGMASVGLTHLGALGELLQNPRPSPGVAINNMPRENYEECESGNEPYDATFPIFNPPTEPQRIGNPPGLQDNEAIETSPPPGTRELAREAGVLPTLGGGR